MDHSVILIVCSIVCSHVLIFAVGVLCGFLLGKNNSQVEYRAPESFLKKSSGQDKKNNKIEIDDKKIVLNINTEGLEKKFDKITEETKTKNNISGSVNKLKSMKGK